VSLDTCTCLPVVSTYSFTIYLLTSEHAPSGRSLFSSRWARTSRRLRLPWIV